MKRRSIDVIRTSASRPELLKVSTESMLKNIRFSGNLKWFLHEDFIIPKYSRECVEYSKSTKLYSEIGISDPPIGQSKSINWLLNKITSSFVLFWEDDYALLAKLNLDNVLDILEDNKDINQIAFAKRHILKDRSDGFIKVERQIGDITITTSPHWNFVPNVFRASYLLPRWKESVRSSQDPHWQFNRYLKGGAGIFRDANWVIEGPGHYFYGALGKHKMVQHLAPGDSQESWRVRLGIQSINNG